MEDLGIVQPRCPECGTAMRDDPSGFRCGGCGHLEDYSAELAAVVMPPEFEGPAIQGG
jgi:tRNA(Ile2) C34 agmatinyltransferase TiaS